MTTALPSPVSWDGKERPYWDFEPVDHLVMRCTAGGLVPYDHHAICLSVDFKKHNDTVNKVESSKNNEKRGTWMLTLADFTANGSDTHTASSGTFLHSGPLVAAANSRDNAQHGMRILSIRSTDEDANLWIKVSHDHEKEENDKTGDDTTNTTPTESHPTVVRARVDFLRCRPHGRIPAYSLVESNCECVAVWCKTGVWTTTQMHHWLRATNDAARVALGATAIACCLVAPALPFMLGAALTEVATGRWKAHAQETWQRQTQKLNDDFVQAQSLQLMVRGGDLENMSTEQMQTRTRLQGDVDKENRSHDDTDSSNNNQGENTTHHLLGSFVRNMIFSDSRSLRGIVGLETNASNV